MKFWLRVASNTLGVWLAVELMDSITMEGGFWSFALTGLVLAAVNTIIKPFVIFLSLPALLVTLGIFMVFINGLMVVIADYFLDRFEVETFSSAVLAGIIIGLVNYAISNINEKDKDK